MRHSEVSRETAETAVKLSLELDGSGRAEVHTGVGFLDHMLTLFACHGGFDLAVSCKGDPGGGRAPQRGGRRPAAGCAGS